MPEEVAADELQTASSSKYHRNHAPYTARIKKMMQADEDVGKVAKASPILICECVGRGDSASSEEFCRALGPCLKATYSIPSQRMHLFPRAAKALDEFLHALLDGAAAVAQERGAKTLTSSHLCVDEAPS